MGCLLDDSLVKKTGSLCSTQEKGPVSVGSMRRQFTHSSRTEGRIDGLRCT